MANLNEQFNKNVASINFPYQGITLDEKLCIPRFSIPPPPLPNNTGGYFSQRMPSQSVHMNFYQFQNIPPTMPGENRNTPLHNFPYSHQFQNIPPTLPIENRNTALPYQHQFQNIPLPLPGENKNTTSHDFPYPQYVGPYSSPSNIYNPVFPPPPQSYFTRHSFPQMDSNNFSQGHNRQPVTFEQPTAWCEDNALGNLNNKGLQHQRMQDELWVNDFLTKIRPREVLKPSMTHHKESIKEFKICEARQKFKTCLNLLEELKMLQEEITAECGSLSLEAWEKKCEEIEVKKTEMSKCLDELCNIGTLETLKKKLDGRKRKRKAEKRRRAERHREAVKAYARRQKLNKDIDSWLEEMKESVEKSKREENLKSDADLVLFDVTRKRAEAKRQLALLTNLIKLRQLKAQTAASRGQPVSTESTDAFEKPIEHLCDLWKDQLKDYNFEEQGLLVMLEEAAEQRNKKHPSPEKQASTEWERVLFGDKIYWDDEDAYNSINAANTSLEAFVDVRKSWDKFVVCESTLTSSSMPMGWVVPVGPTSQAWQAVTHEALHMNIPTSSDIHQTTSQ